MKLIKMLGSGYGHRPAGSKVTQLKRAGDPPFEVEDAEADRLVNKLKVAVYVDPPTDIAALKEKIVKTMADINAAKKQPAEIVATAPADKTDDGEGNTPPAAKPEYGVDMKVAELRELLEENGLTFKVGMTKTEMVAALDEVFCNVAPDDPVDNDSGDNPPEDPEDEVEDAEADANDDQVDDGEELPDLNAEDPVL